MASGDPAPEEDTPESDAAPSIPGGKDDLLLATKLHMPQLPPSLVPRPQLIARLQQAAACPLTLIAAPAGSGKTTLLTAWLRDASVPAVWVSLDGGDNDPIRFWSHTLAALDAIHAGLGAARPLLRSPQPPPLENVLTAVINDLDALTEDVLLVFDDYHAITAQPIHAAMIFLMEHLPARLHLVIATRADPSLPLARLRARGQLLEIRSADLRFTHEEAASFLAHTVGPELSADDITALADRTEGWIAGLQLAALSLQGRQDISTFLQSFTGTNRFVVDYLSEEVLARQPAEVQTFLLQTAVLERLCAPLCEAVTGGQAAQAMLERLEAGNLFLLPLDDERQWFRYHHLFAEMLRQRLQRSQPDHIALLHRRAGAWYARQGLIRDAVNHAVAGADFAQAAHLIEEAAETMVKRGEVATLRAWLATLPGDLIRTRAGLALWHGWLLALEGQHAAAEALLEALGAADRAGSPPSATADATATGLDDAAGKIEHAGRMAAIRAFIAFRQGDAPRTIELARQALTQLPPDTAARGLAAWNLGIAHLWRGDFTEGAAALTEAREISHTAGNSYAAIMMSFEIAQMQTRQGMLHRAEQTYQKALDRISERGDHPLAAGPIYVGRGDLQREWNNLDVAAHDLDEGIARCRQAGQIVMVLLGYIALVRVKQAQGETAGTLDLIHMIEQGLHAASLPPSNAEQLAAWHARLSLQYGDPAAAWSWAQDRQPPVDEALDPAHEIEYLTWVRVQIGQHRPAEVVLLLERLLHLAEHQGRMGSVLEILVLQALALRARGDEAAALERLSRALSLAEPEVYIRLFVDEGAPMAQLLMRMPRDGHGSRRYRDLLLTLLGSATNADDGSSASTAPGAATLSEPLSDRELEVLRLIIAGCSNREIAERLVIAVSTVKWYINAIYGKLQVDSRTRAIARARDLHIE